jgi:hypothetical protein
MPEHAITLLLCDNRQPLEPPAVSADSIIALPLKRERMRNFATVKDIELDGEVVVELEKGIDLEFVVQSTVHKLQLMGDATNVLCPDSASLRDAGILQALEIQLARVGKTLTKL